MEQTELKIDDAPFHPRRHAKPILRWVGGKRSMVEQLSGIAYAHLSKTKGTYIEPFLGGGSVALDLGLPSMILNDFCGPLMRMFDYVRDDPKAVFNQLQQYVERGIDEKTYYEVRALRPLGAIQQAARFLYLNATCFNGVYRENASGEFNVPYGKRANPKFPSLEELVAVQEALGGDKVFLYASDFKPIVQLAREGDFIYADPPYLDTFSDYNAGGFGEPEHVVLAEELRAAYDHGADVLVTNSDTARVRELYDWAFITPIQERRSINRDGDGRGPVGCVLITTVPDLLGGVP